MKLVMATYSNPEKCRICTKIDTKKRYVNKEEEKIKRWKSESGRPVSIEKAEDTIYALKMEIFNLEMDRYVKDEQSFTNTKSFESTRTYFDQLCDPD
jgi:hypothetical protein